MDKIIKKITFEGRFAGDTQYTRYTLEYAKTSGLTREDLYDEDPDSWCQTTAVIRIDPEPILVHLYRGSERKKINIEIYNFRPDGGIGDCIACDLDGSFEFKKMRFTYY